MAENNEITPEISERDLHLAKGLEYLRTSIREELRENKDKIK
jgi:hypothetical protein